MSDDNTDNPDICGLCGCRGADQDVDPLAEYLPAEKRPTTARVHAACEWEEYLLAYRAAGGKCGEKERRRERAYLAKQQEDGKA